MNYELYMGNLRFINYILMIEKNQNKIVYIYLYKLLS